MNKPNFVVGAYDVSPEHPSDWRVTNRVEKDSKTTMGGTLTEDVLYRKYVYELKWDAMSYDDYSDLIELVNYSIDENEEVTFTYPKWSSSSSGVSCRLELSSRDRRGGSGSSDYYSSVTLLVTEVESR